MFFIVGCGGGGGGIAPGQLATKSIEARELNANFDIDPFRKNSLMLGLDDVGITLEFTKEIDSYERKQTKRW